MYSWPPEKEWWGLFRKKVMHMFVQIWLHQWEMSFSFIHLGIHFSLNYFKWGTSYRTQWRNWVQTKVSWFDSWTCSSGELTCPVCVLWRWRNTLSGPRRPEQREYSLHFFFDKTCLSLLSSSVKGSSHSCSVSGQNMMSGQQPSTTHAVTSSAFLSYYRHNLS